MYTKAISASTLCGFFEGHKHAMECQNGGIRPNPRQKNQLSNTEISQVSENVPSHIASACFGMHLQASSHVFSQGQRECLPPPTPAPPAAAKAHACGRPHRCCRGAPRSFCIRSSDDLRVSARGFRIPRGTPFRAAGWGGVARFGMDSRSGLQIWRLGVWGRMIEVSKW